MTKVLIGSKAIEYHFPNFRKTVDTDFLIEKVDMEVPEGASMLPNGFYIKNDNRITEYSVADELREELIGYIVNEDNSKFENDYYIPSPEVLLSLKLTHRYKKNSPHFLKTMWDINFLRSKGVKPIESDLFRRIEKDTLNYNKPSLNQVSKDFFQEKDQENYGHNFDHDSIHQAVKLFDEPAYFSYMKDGQEVLCDKEKWNNSSEHIKIAGVYEECAVLALERSLIVNDFNEPEKIFKIALEKVCTSITSGWFREFAWENYFTVLKLAEILKFDRMEEKFKEGISMNIIKERN